MIVAGYPPAVGGAERNCERLSRWLARHDVDVTVVTRGQALAPAREGRDGVRVTRSRRFTARNGAPLRALDAASYLALVAAEIGRARRRGVDVIHVHGIDYPLPLVRLLAGNGCAVVLTVLCAGQDGEVHRLLRRGGARQVLRWGLARVDRFQSAAPPIRDELLEIGTASERCVDLPFGIEIPVAPSSGDEEPAVVLFGGRLVDQKCPDVLLEAWAQARSSRSGARLDVAGVGPLLADLQQASARLGIEPSVRFVGTPPDWSARLARCAVFVLPSRAEGMSNALLEAMAAARPIVTTDIPENRHVLGDAAIFVPVGDVTALARALDAVLTDARLRGDLGARSRARAVERFAMDRVGEGHLAMYRSAIDDRSAAGAHRRPAHA